MATNSSHFLSDKYVKAANVFEKAKGKIESALHSDITHHHNKETHGIDENTPLTDVKSPNLFERAKEEIEALVETIHQKSQSQDDEKRDESTRAESQSEKSDKEVNVSNLIEKAKEKVPDLIENAKENVPDLIEKAKGKIESTMRHHGHQKETHGKRDDINENTPIGEVKGPSVFERAKEEFEAIVETIHPNEEPPIEPVTLPKEEEEEKGLWCSIGKWLENICSPKPVDRKTD